jgi:hypothetical protein
MFALTEILSASLAIIALIGFLLLSLASYFFAISIELLSEVSSSLINVEAFTFRSLNLNVEESAFG